MIIKISPMISIESRKRAQIYLCLDFLCSQLSYLDIMTTEMFYIFFTIDCLYQTSENDIINPAMLAAPFIADLRSEKRKYIKLSKKALFLIKKKLKSKVKKKSRKKLLVLKEIKKQKKEIFNGINFLLLDVLEKCIYDFKTIVITPEIFFFILLENHVFQTAFLLKNLSKNNNDFFFNKLQILKYIYFQEFLIKRRALKNYRYYACLFRIALSKASFFEKFNTYKSLPLKKALQKKAKKEYCNSFLSTFRAYVLSCCLRLNLAGLLKNDINRGIRLTSSRGYLTINKDLKKI